MEYFVYIIGILSVIITIIFLSTIYIKMDISDVVKSYIKIFVDFKTDKVSKKDIFAYFILPMLTSATLALFITINKAFVNSLLTSFAIFLGLMLSLLVLVLDLIEKNKNEKYIKKLGIEIFHSVSFAILISLMLVLIGLFLSLDFNFLKTTPIYFSLKIFISFIIYYLILLFVSDLFIVLKRVNTILKEIIERKL